jgi:hypothetical protein
MARVHAIEADAQVGQSERKRRQRPLAISCGLSGEQSTFNDQPGWACQRRSTAGSSKAWSISPASSPSETAWQSAQIDPAVR